MEVAKLGSRILRSLESLTLLLECRELKEAYDTHYTDAVPRADEGEGPHPREMKEEMWINKEMRLARCSQADRAPPVVPDIVRVVVWEKLWDTSLDKGAHCIQRMKCLVKKVDHRCFGDLCPWVHKEMMDSLAKLK